MTERNPIPYCLAHLTQLGAATPPPRLSVVRSTPRADLIAEYRRLVDVCDDLIRGTDDPGAEALAAIYCSRLVLGRAEAIPDEAPKHPPSTTAIRAIIERAAQHLVIGASHAWIFVLRDDVRAAEQEIAAIERGEGT